MGVATIPSHGRPTAVEIVQVAGEWFVRVTAPQGGSVRTFSLESRAIDFAVKQCLDLSLEKYERL